MSNNDPLARVQLQRPPSDSSPTASAAAVSAFQAKASGAAHPDPAGEEPAPPPVIPAPTLTESEILELQRLRTILDANQMQAEDIADEMESMRRLRERNKQIEGRLKPLRLADLLIHDYLQQEIPLSEGAEGVVLVYRTVAADIELDIEAVARDLFTEYGGEKSTNLTFLESVATLACGLISLAGAPQAATAIAQMPAASAEERKARRDAIQASTREFLRKPYPLLQELFDHQRLFVARVRKTLQHHGFVDQELGNS